MNGINSLFYNKLWLETDAAVYSLSNNFSLLKATTKIVLGKTSHCKTPSDVVN